MPVQNCVTKASAGREDRQDAGIMQRARCHLSRLPFNFSKPCNWQVQGLSAALRTFARDLDTVKAECAQPSFLSNTQEERSMHGRNTGMSIMPHCLGRPEPPPRVRRPRKSEPSLARSLCLVAPSACRRRRVESSISSQLPAELCVPALTPPQAICGG